ncbi:type IV secretion system DNA-binding domain-containing protein [Clostridium estertheticum]|uniref:type IV secretion system DNA-binding domain-containing protein n=1 Tax=Clostridium estertheticum TaxID=238834 RepID=UPI001C0D827A|nr:type IV secretory system conjugative DNA transfer family protein [Clostridium estertheticum]MBU3173276.1 type IV secretory system conjugative DNA transfer family protein [Clostridium estertheticum]
MGIGDFFNSLVKKSANLFSMESLKKKESLVINNDVNTLVLGSEGTGKTRKILIPTVCEIAKTGKSMVIADRRGTIYNSTCDYLKKQGYNLVIVNLYEEPIMSLFDIEGLESMGTDKTVVFIIFDFSQDDRNTMASLIIEKVYKSLLDLSIENDSKNMRNVTCILDDLSMIPHLSNFDKMLENGPSNGFKYIVAIQGIGQIEKVYHDTFNKINGNFKNIVFLGTPDMETAKFIVKKAGRTRLDNEHINYMKGIDSVPRFLLDEVLRLERNKCIFITNDDIAKIFDLPSVSEWETSKGITQCKGR